MSLARLLAVRVCSWRAHDKALGADCSDQISTPSSRQTTACANNAVTFGQQWSRYDPAVPATSNVASTAAGARGLLPVPFCPHDNASLYNLLLHGDRAGALGVRLGSADGLPVAIDLVGKFNGSRTGSSKADAYMWAKETFLDTGEVLGDTLG